MKNLRTTLIAATAALAVAVPAHAANAHPLITDPAGDASVIQVRNCPTVGPVHGCPRVGHDPALDILTGDVSATTTTMTATMTLAQLAAPGTVPGFDVYEARIHTVGRDMWMRVFKDRTTGAVSGRAAIGNPLGECCQSIPGATATSDPATGTVAVTVSFEAVNAVIAVSGGGATVGKGTAIDVSFASDRWVGLSPDDLAVSNEYDTTDVYSGYRLGS
jgi:hypothetical protein